MLARHAVSPRLGQLGRTLGAAPSASLLPAAAVGTLAAPPRSARMVAFL